MTATELAEAEADEHARRNRETADRLETQMRATHTVLLVQLEAGLNRSRVYGLFLAIQQLPVVQSVADACVVDRATLDQYLLKIPDGPLPARRRRERAHA